MKYQTSYKNRKILIKQTESGDYTAIRILGCSTKKMGGFINATQALAWIKKAIDSNRINGACKVLSW